MFEHLKAALFTWNGSTTDRQKLQHTYLVSAIVVTFVAGVVTLFNASTGHSVMLVALFALAAFLANAVVWSLLNSAVVLKLSNKPRRK